MRLSTLLVYPTSFALVALGGPLDSIPARATATATASNPLIVLSVFSDTECQDRGSGANVTNGRLEIAHEQQCFALHGGGEGTGTATATEKWGGLKVEWAHERLRYNSLRVYESADCSGPWTLEPIRCGGGGGADDGSSLSSCACSQIPTFDSIKLQVD